jgi:uncharacterized Zn-finger protein
MPAIDLALGSSQRKSRTRAMGLLRLLRRYLRTLLLCLFVEVPLAYALEHILELHAPEILHRLEQFQARFVAAVSALQPAAVFDIFQQEFYQLLPYEGLGASYDAFRHTIRVLRANGDDLVSWLIVIGLSFSVFLVYYVYWRIRPPPGISQGNAIVSAVFLGTLFGVAAFCAFFWALQWSLILGALLFGRLIYLAQLAFASSAFLILMYVLLVRTEHALVEWIKHGIERCIEWRRHREPAHRPTGLDDHSGLPAGEPDIVHVGDCGTVACDGGSDEFGHPLVFLRIVNGEARCPYCSRLFVLDSNRGGA